MKIDFVMVRLGVDVELPEENVREVMLDYARKFFAAGGALGLSDYIEMSDVTRAAFAAAFAERTSTVVAEPEDPEAKATRDGLDAAEDMLR